MGLRTTFSRCAGIGLAALALLVVPATADAYQQRQPAEFFGINANELVLGTWTDPAGTDRHLAAISDTGIGAIRADVSWGQVEGLTPVGDVHTYEWIFYDRWVEQLAKAGMTWQAMPSGAPLWARDLGSTLAGCGDRSAPDVSKARDYGAFVEAFVNRYGRDGTFWTERPSLPYHPVESVELWNEPNWGGFWCAGPNPEVYSQFALAGALGAHAADPEIEASIGGLVTTRQDIMRDGVVWGMRTDEYLRRVIAAAPALAQEIDGVALHLYDQDPDVNLSLIGWMHRQMESLGMDGAGISITEFGWHTKGGVDFVDEPTRAANYHDLVLQLARTDCGISALAPYTWISSETDPGDPEQWFGMARADSTLKPAGAAYAKEVARFLGRGSAPAPRKTVTVCGGAAPDQDGDGVPDSEDEYPLDPDRSEGSGEEEPPDPDEPPESRRPPRVPSDFFGAYVRQMPWEAAKRQAYYDSMDAAGFGSVRDSVLWSHAELSAPGDSGHSFSWSETDARVLGLAKRGMRVQPSFVWKPGWVGTDQASGDAAFAEFLAGYARQYGPGGTFWSENGHLDPELAVRDFEIWSDVNFPHGGWDGSSTPSEYAATYETARAALRSVDPSARAIVPLHAEGSTGSAGSFLRDMVAARPSLTGQIDGVYVQFLQAKKPELVQRGVAQVRQALIDTGNPSAPIRVGAGWYTKGHQAVGERKRAKLMSTTASRLARSNCGVDGFFADAWTMDKADKSNPWHWLGIANPESGALDRTGRAYASVAKSFLGMAKKKAPRATMRDCGTAAPDRDGDGVLDPNDDFPIDASQSESGRSR